MRRALMEGSSRRIRAIHGHASSLQSLERRTQGRPLLGRSHPARKRRHAPHTGLRDIPKHPHRHDAQPADQYHARTGRLGIDSRRTNDRHACLDYCGTALQLRKRLPEGRGRQAQPGRANQLAAPRHVKVQWLAGSRKPSSPATPGAANAAGGPAQTTTTAGAAASTPHTPTADATESYSAAPATSGRTPTRSRPAKPATSSHPMTPSRGRHQSKP